MAKYTVRKCYRALEVEFATLEITSKCNSRCKTCNVWKMQSDACGEERSELTPDELFGIIVQLQELGCQSVELHGGEPTLRRDLPELVAFCSQRGIWTMFATNGLNMSHELAAELVGAGLSEIRFSLDGPRETHNMIRGRDDAFDRQMQAIEAIHGADRNNQVTKVINTTISSLNIQNVEKTVDVARQMKITNMLVFLASVIEPKVARLTNKVLREEVAYARSILDCDLLIHNADLIERKRKQLLRRLQEQNVCVNQSTFFTMPISQIMRGIKRDSEPCRAIYSSCTIDPFGNVFPCEYIRYRLGSAREKDLKEILTSSRYRQFSRLYSENIGELRVCDYCCHSL